MDLKELKDACSLLGIDYNKFVEDPIELEKGVQEKNYKELYEEQLIINKTILGNIGEISKSFDSKIENFEKNILDTIKDELREITKAYSSVEEEIKEMKESPMRNSKTVKNVNVIEKSLGGKNDLKTFSLDNNLEKKQLKKILGDLALNELSKGVKNGIYEQAALQLDAGNIEFNIRKHLLDYNKIQVI